MSWREQRESKNRISQVGKLLDSEKCAAILLPFPQLIHAGHNIPIIWVLKRSRLRGISFNYGKFTFNNVITDV